MHSAWARSFGECTPTLVCLPSSPPAHDTHAQVNPTAITFATLQRETDRLIKIETAAVARTIARRQERGQAIPEDMEDAAECSSWLGIFVS
jgi:hypothetical protein